MGKSNQSGHSRGPVINHVGGNVIANNYGTVRQVSFGGVQSVNVNGKDFQGSQVEQRNGRTFIDGKDVTDEVGIVAELVVIVQGSVEQIEAHGCGSISIAGDAGQVTSMAGDIKVAGKVAGNVHANAGNIKCGAVGGSVKANAGNIKHVKAESGSDDDDSEKPGFFGRFFGGQ